MKNYIIAFILAIVAQFILMIILMGILKWPYQKTYDSFLFGMIVYLLSEKLNHDDQLKSLNHSSCNCNVKY